MKDKVENGTELSDMNTDNVEANGKTEAAGNRSVSCLTRIWSFFTFFTVEPFLLSFILAYGVISNAEQKFKMEKACRADFNYTEDICKKVVGGDTNDSMILEAKNASTILVIDTLAWQIPLQCSVVAILILFVGAWSDRTGNRKALMLIPIIGEFIAAFGLLLATYYFQEWPLWVTALVQSVPSALGGGNTFAGMGALSFIADITTLDSRTFRISVVVMIVTLGIPLSTYVSGVLTESHGYYEAFVTGMALYIMGFVYTCFRVHNVRNDKIEGTLMQKLINFVHPRNAWDTISLLFLTPVRQRIQIVLIVCAFFAVFGSNAGTGTVNYVYVLNRYQMSHMDYTLYSTYASVMGPAGTVAVTALSKVLKMHDAVMGIIGTSSKTIANIVYGLAPTREWFYSGPAFDFFASATVIANKSLVSKVVNPSDVGKMNSLMGFAEALLPMVFSPLYSKLSSITLYTLPGAVYLLAAAMTVSAFFIFIALYIMHKKEERDVVKNPPAKEMHAYDNDVTVL